ncbi:MAG: hypothetical protein J7L96_09925 [Bacteroidales bacterium]|nr:hypothetical protein [Bacteroidales bacterium]
MIRRAISIVLILSGVSLSLHAQLVDKYGGDKQACGRNYTIYYEMYKLGQYKEAIPYWKKTIAICPAFSVSLWKTGEKMFKKKIENTPPSIERETLIDTLLWIYDQRIKYFGNKPRSSKGYVLGKKGLAIRNYRKNDTDKAYACLGESLSLEENLSKPNIVLAYMQMSQTLFNEGTLNAEDVLIAYETCMRIINANLTNKPKDTFFIRAKQGVESSFAKSGAADCDALTSVYQTQLPEHNTDKDWLEKVRHQFQTASCTNNDFYLSLLIKLFELTPNGEAAHNLAHIYLLRENYNTAASYLKKALDHILPDGEQAQAWYELAFIQFSHFKKYSEARSSARNALAIRPNWGEPHLLIGKIYLDVRETAFDDEFDQSSLFWAAVDQFDTAKKIDPQTADKANDLIATYSQFFPTSETMFFHGLKEGQKYTIGSWLNIKTTARAKK